MDFIITFFRDILDGPIYIVVAIISIILICSCIGYLAETSLNKKKAKQEYDNSHANLSSTSTSSNISNEVPKTIGTPIEQPGVANTTRDVNQ